MARCQNKLPLTRDAAITEATRLGYPVAPYRCPNGRDHWHVGNSKGNGQTFHNNRTRWERLARNQGDEHDKPTS
jgi:hypothetical protein